MKKHSPNYFLPLLVATLLMFGGFAVRSQQTQTDDKTDTNAPKSESKSKKKAATANSATPAAATTSAPTASVNIASTAPAKSAPTATAAPASAPAATAAKPAAQQQAPHANGMVWVNIDSGIYHKPGTKWYGKTKQGKYMTEADAQKAGYRPAEKE